MGTDFTWCELRCSVFHIPTTKRVHSSGDGREVEIGRGRSNIGDADTESGRHAPFRYVIVGATPVITLRATYLGGIVWEEPIRENIVILL